MRQLLIIGIVALCAQFSAAETFASEPDRAQRVLDHFVHEITSIKANFEQSLVDANNDVIDESKGFLEIQRPGRFRWTYTEPYEQLLVADGVDLWSYDADLAQVIVKPQATVLASTPALLLGGSAEALDDFTILESFTDGETFWIRLEPRSDDSGFTGLDLGFNNEQLTRMMFFDNLGQTTLVALKDIQTNIEISSSEFSFTVPDGVDVVGQATASVVTP